jgi:hypothetical protein
LRETSLTGNRYGAEAVKELPTILTHGEFTKHVVLTPSSLVLQSPVTEVLLAYFPTDISATGKDEAIAQFKEFVEKSFDGSPDVGDFSFGWGVENDFPVRGQGGQVGSVLMAFIGWPSIQASVENWETEGFKKNVELIKGIDGITKLVMFRISCRSLERKAE